MQIWDYSILAANFVVQYDFLDVKIPGIKFKTWHVFFHEAITDPHMYN